MDFLSDFRLVYIISQCIAVMIQDNKSVDSIVEYRICGKGKAYISQILPLSGLSDAATIASRLYCTFFLYFVARSAAVLTPLFALKISSKQ